MGAGIEGERGAIIEAVRTSYYDLFHRTEPLRQNLERGKVTPADLSEQERQMWVDYNTITNALMSPYLRSSPRGGVLLRTSGSDFPELVLIEIKKSAIIYEGFPVDGILRAIEYERQKCRDGKGLWWLPEDRAETLDRYYQLIEDNSTPLWRGYPSDCIEPRKAAEAYIISQDKLRVSTGPNADKENWYTACCTLDKR